MIVPSVADVVRTIAHSLDDIIAPAMQTSHQRSTIVTIGHMLRYVQNATDREGPLLFEEANRLRVLLADLGKRSAGADMSAAIASIGGAMRSAVAEPRDASIYPSTPRLAAEIKAFTQHADDMLAAVHALPADARSGATAALHQALRDHIAWQLENEAKLIEPAFVGHGPRR
jgi:hypothetical protein